MHSRVNFFVMCLIKTCSALRAENIQLDLAGDGETAFSQSINVRGNPEFSNAWNRCIMRGDLMGVVHVVFPSGYSSYVNFGLQHLGKKCDCKALFVSFLGPKCELFIAARKLDGVVSITILWWKNAWCVDCFLCVCCLFHWWTGFARSSDKKWKIFHYLLTLMLFKTFFCRDILRSCFCKYCENSFCEDFLCME